MADRVLVTGGTGFVGGHLLRALISSGRSVVALDINPPDRFFPVEADFIQGDMCDRATVMAAARGCDVVVANGALVPITQAGAAEFMRVNAGGTRNTLGVAAAYDAYGVYVSSSAIFGVPAANPLPADAPMAPYEDYGRSKAAGERAVRDLRSRGLVAASLRPRTLVGAGRLGLFEMIFERVRGNKRVPIFGNGCNSVQLVDADDYAAALVAAIDRRATGDYNIGARDFGTVREDLEDLILAVGSTSQLQPLPVPLVKGALRSAAALRLSPFTAWHWGSAASDFYFEIDHAENELGWSPQKSNAEALVDAYRVHISGPREGGGSAHRKPLSRLVGKMLRA